jgi:hypothetical protein
MRKGILGVALAALVALGLTHPASAGPGGGVVMGTMTPDPPPTPYDFRMRFNVDFTGNVEIGGAGYRGQFNVAGLTDWMAVKGRGPYPYRFEGDFPVAGTNAVGDSVAGTCGLLGSIWDPDASRLHLVCNGAVNGRPPSSFTLTTSYGAVNEPPTYTNAITGIFTSDSVAANAGGLPTVEEKVRVDPNQIIGDSGPAPSGLVGLCLTAKPLSPDATCVHA